MSLVQEGEYLRISHWDSSVVAQIAWAAFILFFRLCELLGSGLEPLKV